MTCFKVTARWTFKQYTLMDYVVAVLALFLVLVDYCIVLICGASTTKAYMCPGVYSLNSVLYGEDVFFILYLWFYHVQKHCII